MKNSILLTLVLLMCSAVGVVAAADYDGSPKYPATTLVSGQFTLVVSGVVQTKTFSQLHTAMSAAVVTSQKCSCEVLIKSPDIRINTKWRAVVPGETTLTFNWDRPTTRENGQYLPVTELGGYGLTRISSAGVSYGTTVIPNTGSDAIQYTATMAYSPNDKFLIAAFDTNGLYSNSVELEHIVGDM